MENTLEIGEITIVVVAKNHNPTILNPDFLKYNHIVPENWKLKKDPVCIGPMAQVIFDNGIQITAEMDKVIFFESTKDKKDLKDIKIHEIAINYINALPHVNYSSVGINPKGHIFFTTADDAQNFIKDKFTNAELWKQFDNKPINVGFKFSYNLEKTVMSVAVEASLYNISPEKKVPVVLFAANLHHNVLEETKDARLNNLKSIINDWHKDIDRYREFVKKLIGE